MYVSSLATEVMNAADAACKKTGVQFFQPTFVSFLFIYFLFFIIYFIILFFIIYFFGFIFSTNFCFILAQSEFGIFLCFAYFHIALPIKD
jgi:hypothetical protein